MAHPSQLTIVTPALNAAATLRATLLSLRPLIHAGAEHIVVDSGSQDGTALIATEGGAKVLYHPEGNMYAAINAGFAASTRPWLTYINADDLLYSDATIRCLRLASATEEFVYGSVDFIDDVGRFLFSRRPAAPHALTWTIRYYSPVYQQGMLYRREVYNALGGFDTTFRYAADYDFVARGVLRGCKFRRFNGASVAAFRILPSQLSQSRGKAMVPEAAAISRRVMSTAPGEPWGGRHLATAYRRATNIDGLLMRALRCSESETYQAPPG